MATQSVLSGGTVPPHGGELIDLTVGGDDREALRERAASLPTIRLNARALFDLELLGNGGNSPLRGFMGRVDYESVVESMRLSSGLPWPIPVTLAVSAEEAAPLREGQAWPHLMKRGNVM